MKEVINALNKSATYENVSITYETQKLIDTIVRTSSAQLAQIQSTFEQFKFSQFSSRTKRELVNPFHGIGKVVEWAFGLTSHEHFDQVKDSVNDHISSLVKDEQSLAISVQQNSREIQESMKLLKVFDKFLKNIAEHDSQIVNTDRLFLKLMRHKFDLDTSLDNIRCGVWHDCEKHSQLVIGRLNQFLTSLAEFG